MRKDMEVTPLPLITVRLLFSSEIFFNPHAYWLAKRYGSLIDSPLRFDLMMEINLHTVKEYWPLMKEGVAEGGGGVSHRP